MFGGPIRYMAFPIWFLPWIHINNKYNVHLEVGRESEREREFSRRRRELFYRKFHQKSGTTTMAKDLTTTKYTLGLLVLTIVFTILSSIVAGLRFYVRISMRSFAVEDWMMLAGWVSLALL